MLPDATHRHYQGDAGRRYHDEKRGIPNCALEWVMRLRAEKFAPFVKPTDNVFEYGVGAGWNLALLKAGRKSGHDVSDFLASRLGEWGIEFIADPVSIAGGTVDVALCHHTLEHVANPLQVLAHLRRVLRAEGTLLLYTPFECEDRYRRYNPDEPNHHLYSWNTQTLGNLVSEAGFQVRRAGLGEFGYDRRAAVWAAGMKMGERGFRCLRRALHCLKPAHEVRIVASNIIN